MVWKSQYQQDRWVAEIVYPDKRAGVFLDVGAHDGIWLSNTYFLERERGWNGLLVEADDRCFEKLAGNRSADRVHVCLDEAEGFVDFYVPQATDGLGGIAAEDTDSRAERLEARREKGQQFEIRRVPARTLTSVLDERAFPTTIDYMSIDIEGAELRAFKGLDLGRYRFGALTIERPKGELRTMLADRGYRKVGELVHDCLFVHPDLVDADRIETETVGLSQAVAEAHRDKKSRAGG
jgi:FkbM family methyltransferase